MEGVYEPDHWAAGVALVFATPFALVSSCNISSRFILSCFDDEWNELCATNSVGRFVCAWTGCLELVTNRFWASAKRMR
jgi:hypothetical protein